MTCATARLCGLVLRRGHIYTYFFLSFSVIISIIISYIRDLNSRIAEECNEYSSEKD